MATPELAELVLELDLLIPTVRDWRRASIPSNEADARAFEGTALGWRFVVVDFDIEPQGFPKGERGYDGAATHKGRAILYHLTRNQARRAFTAALTQCASDGLG